MSRTDASGRNSWERGRPARKWAAGPQMFKRAGRPRSRESLTNGVAQSKGAWFFSEPGRESVKACG